MDAEFIRDLFSSFRPVTVRRMFGGAGIYADGTMFALIAGDVIYLKAGAANEADFEREGLPPFRYEAANGKRAVMSYRRMPERLYDDPDELAQWAARALAVALSKAAPRRPAAPRKRGKSTPKRRLTKR
jgi:DNA transformation protein and related proteins